MREKNRLTGLKVRIAGEHHAHVLLGFGNHGLLQIADRFDDFYNGVTGVKTDIKLRLIVSRTRRVHLAAHRSHDFGDAPLNCHLNVFIGHIKYKFAVLNFFSDGIQPLQNLFGFLLRQNVLRGKHVHMCRAADNGKRRHALFNQNRCIKFLNQVVHRQVKTTAPHCIRHFCLHQKNFLNFNNLSTVFA